MKHIALVDERVVVREVLANKVGFLTSLHKYLIAVYYRRQELYFMINQDTIWSQAIHLFFVISGWLVAPLVLGWFIGTTLDTHYQSRPWLLLLSLGVAFVVTNIGLAIEMKRYLRQLKDIESAK